MPEEKNKDAEAKMTPDELEKGVVGGRAPQVFIRPEAPEVDPPSNQLDPEPTKG